MCHNSNTLIRKTKTMKNNIRLIFKATSVLVTAFLLSSCITVANITDSIARKARETAFSSSTGRYLKVYSGGAVIRQIDFHDENACRAELASESSSSGVLRCEKNSSADELLVSALFSQMDSGLNIEMRANSVPSCESMVIRGNMNLKTIGQLNLIRPCKYFHSQT